MLSKQFTLSKIFAYILLGILLLPVTSCSKDDEPDGGNGATSSAFNLGGQPLKLSYAYWWANAGDMHIEFYSYDPTGNKFPNSMSYLSIDYSIPSNQTEIESVTLPSGSYSIYVAKDVTMSSEGWQGQTKWNDSTNSPLIIEKDGKNVKITVENATISDYSESLPLTINFNSSIKKLPEKYWDI